jgi:NADH-quinone oxidoreductase subunit M
MILLGVFQSKLAIAIIAFAGVIGAAYYALRLFIGAMHNRPGPKVVSRELGLTELATIVPIVLVILVLAFYPQFGLRRSEPSVRAALAPAQAQALNGANPYVHAGIQSGWTAYAPIGSTGR